MTIAETVTPGVTPDLVRDAAERVDFVQADRLLSDEERGIRDRVRRWVDERVIPVMPEYWHRAEFPFDLLPDLGALGLMGGAIKGYGCAGWNNVAYGLAVQELARGSGSLATFLHVQSGLVMTVLHELGSEEQRQRWLPGLARCELLGAFALTEPNVGSDAGSIQTRAARRGGDWVLNGAKRWIGNGSIADVAAVVARDDEGRVGVFLVEKGTPGYRAEVIPRKGSQRAVWQAEIALEDCRVPAENRLPNCRGLGSILVCLTHSRYGVAWDGLGQSMDCYETALAYARERLQFGQQLTSFQLIQQRLVSMVTEISLAQLLSIHIGRMKDEGTATPGQISMLKMNNMTKARQIAALARESLGGNGILLDYRVMEHMADIEGAYTYEGTNDVNMLIVGQAITGNKAFVAAAPQRQEHAARSVER